MDSFLEYFFHKSKNQLAPEGLSRIFSKLSIGNQKNFEILQIYNGIDGKLLELYKSHLGVYMSKAVDNLYIRDVQEQWIN